MIDTETGEILGITRHEKPFVKTPYNYDRNAESKAAGLACPDESKAQQNAKEDADINTLVKRFGITGKMPVLDKVPLQGDFHDITSFKEAADRLLEAQHAFMQLPADTRYKFHNDPNEFLEFTSNPENRDEMRKMGFLKPETPAPEPVIVRLAEQPGGTPKPPAPGDTGAT